MKSLIPFALAMLLASPMLAQSLPGESKKDANTQEQKAPDMKQKTADPAFVDENNDGIDDRRGQADENSEKNRKHRKGNRKRDVFVDEDGDGINDARCEGLGFRRGNGRQIRGGKK